MSSGLEIPQVNISGGDGPHLLITAGVHGDEFEPMTAVRQLIEEFRRLKLQGRVTLVPVVNEPAFRRAERTAEDGLDLARVCPGSADGSITERVADAFSDLIRTADYFIDMHTGGRRYVVEPLVGYGLHNNEKVLDRQRAMARAFNLPIVWGTQNRLDGRSLSIARDAEIPALYAEYGGGGGNPAAVQEYVDGCLNVAAMLGIIERKAIDSRVRYFVEDDRDEAGHLQMQHPAPSQGFFQPQVQLGQPVRRGEPLGKLLDVLGEQRTAVLAAEDGIVLFLRAVPSAQEGDALGGILPISEPGEVRFERSPSAMIRQDGTAEK